MKKLLTLASLIIILANCSGQGSGNTNTQTEEKNDPFADLNLIPCTNPSDCDTGNTCTQYGVCLTPCTNTTECDGSKSYTCNDSGLCVTPDIAKAINAYEEAHNTIEIKMVSASITGTAVLSKNYPKQFRDLFYSTFNSGSKMARGRLFVRYCSDAECKNPIGLVMAAVEGMDANGVYMYSSGFPKEFYVDSAPEGKSFAQLILDTQFSVEQGKGGCTNIKDCPGDADTLSTDTTTVEVNSGGNQENNPKANSKLLQVTSGGSASLGDLSLGSIYFSGKELWTPATPETGYLLAATSNDEASFRNKMALVDLTNYSV